MFITYTYDPALVLKSSHRVVFLWGGGGCKQQGVVYFLIKFTIGGIADYRGSIQLLMEQQRERKKNFTVLKITIGVIVEKREVLYCFS